MGAIAMILWHFTDGTKEGVRMLTPDMIVTAERRSVQWDEAIRIPRGTGYLIFDPLKAYADQAKFPIRQET